MFRRQPVSSRHHAFKRIGCVPGASASIGLAPVCHSGPREPARSEKAARCACPWIL